MAITIGASTQNNGNTASVDLPIPAHAAGDLLLAWFESTGQAIGTTPAGWTLVGATSTRGSLYTQVDTAGTASGTASWGLTAANRWAGGITAFSGVDPAIWDLGAPVISGATTASLVLPGITPPDAGTVLITGFANSSPSVSATVPTGFTAQNTVTSSGYVVLATQPWPGANAATGDVTWNQSSSRACGGFLGALKPASSGGTTVTGSAAPTLPRIVAAAAAVVALTGSAALGLPALQAGGVASVATTGQAQITMPSLRTTGNGTAQVAGSGALALPALTAHGTGAVGDAPITGAAVLTLPSLQASGTGAAATTGAADVQLPQMQAAAAGDLTLTGAGAAALPQLTATGTGTVTGGQPAVPKVDVSVTIGPTVLRSIAVGAVTTSPPTVGPTVTQPPLTAGPAQVTWGAGPTHT